MVGAIALALIALLGLAIALFPKLAVRKYTSRPFTPAALWVARLKGVAFIGLSLLYFLRWF
jgi:hypothetical protein